MSFEISDKVNSEKVFLVYKSQLEGRLEPEYYTPFLRNLESTVRKQSKQKLRYFIKGIAGGATPSTTKSDKYYTDKENGYPFLRVQNLQTDGKLNFNNLKYINEKTHNGKLKRSRVEEGDLLIKITGVGRMAIASVAPKGFCGNTNQHMVVIKTKDRKTSEYLANYLNLDLVEILASRRATGATRPALDYRALKSIPIIEDIDFDIIEEAQHLKAQKEAEAESLLNSIDDYLLGELGIELPEKDSSLENRIFETSFQQVSGERFDSLFSLPFYEKLLENLENANYKLKTLELVSSKILRSFNPQKNKSYGYIQLGSIGRNSTKINELREIALPNIPSRAQQVVHSGEILFSQANPQWGVHILTSDEYDECPVSSGFTILNPNRINGYYLIEILRSNFYCALYNKYLTGAGLFLTISQADLMKTKIPVPPIEKQDEIAAHIRQLRKQARKLKTQARQAVENARQKIETMILADS